jgi:hypothetical protein
MLQEVGGARGDIAGGTCSESSKQEPLVSRRLATSRGVVNRECLTIPELAALQIGQAWDVAGPALKSAHK